MAANLIRLALALAPAAPALAGEQSYTVSSPMTPMPFTNVVLDVPQFIPTVGRLDSIVVNTDVWVEGTLSVENTSSQPLPPMSSGSSCSSLYYPLAENIFTLVQGQGIIPWSTYYFGDTGACMPILDAFDGVIDYSGPSGGVSSYYAYGGGRGTPAPGWAVPWLLDAFSGYGATHLSIGASPGMPGGLPPQLQYVQTMSGRVVVRVTYFYSDYPSEFCFHNGGGGSPCPCDAGTYPAGFGCPVMDIRAAHYPARG